MEPAAAHQSGCNPRTTGALKQVYKEQNGSGFRATSIDHKIEAVMKASEDKKVGY